MRYILDFVDGTSEKDVKSYLKTNKCKTLVILNTLGLIYIVEAAKRPADAAILENIVEDAPEGVTLYGIQDPIQYKAFDTEADDNWWKVAVIADVKYEAETTEIVRTGQEVRVYLMDSGIRADHADFLGKNITLLHSKTGDFADTTGHGTALASVIVGETCGITEAALKVVKIIEKGQPTLVSDILVALDRIAEDYAADPTATAVLNLSWAIGKNDYVEAKLRVLMTHGLVVMAAAGNSGVQIADMTPAAMPEVVTVGSFNQELKPSVFTNYTGSSTSLTKDAVNFGPGLDVFAPGEEIRVATIDGGWGYSAGTSIATAITTAVAVINLSMVNAPLAQRSYETTLYTLREHFLSRNFLTLEGPYSECVNAIPRARMVRLQGTDSDPRTVKVVGLFASGQEFSLRVFDAGFYTSARLAFSTLRGAEIIENHLHATAPKVDKQKSFAGEIEVLDGETVMAVVPYHIAVFNPEQYPSEAEAYADSDLVMLQCNCGPKPCCAVCDKTTGFFCDECAIPGGPFEWVCA